MTVDAPELSDTYDLLTLLENAMDDCDFAEELLDRFQLQLVASRQTLEMHVQAGDQKAAASTAHSIKGEAGVLAASKVRGVAERLEIALQRPSDADVMPLVNELRAETDRCLNSYSAARTAIREIQRSDG